MAGPKSRIPDILIALEHGDRRRAASLIGVELRTGSMTGEKWASVSKLASQIGEIDFALEASRRFSQTEPTTLDRLLSYCGALAQFGRSHEALSLLDRLPTQVQGHPNVCHFRGTISSENGDFEQAATYFRKALQVNPRSSETWFALAMIKTFEKNDPDYHAMIGIEGQCIDLDGLSEARYYYSLGKVLVDMGNIERGFVYYEKGARIRRLLERYNPSSQETLTQNIITDFTPQTLGALKPSRFQNQRALFVHGFPRSGTTLVESILVGHAQVTDGAELNLFQAALIPVGKNLLNDAQQYEKKNSTKDPWGEIAGDYHRMLRQRFPGKGIVVDKTLNQSSIMGLLLHAMPRAKVIWLRRNPEDIALSAYRTYFSTQVPWSWSMEDIAHMMKQEDRLFAHWSAIFPDRILPINYEDLVTEPDKWIPQILNHAGLSQETRLTEFYRSRRQIRTASVREVRSGISTKAVGRAKRFALQLEPFRKAYRR